MIYIYKSSSQKKTHTNYLYSNAPCLQISQVRALNNLKTKQYQNPKITLQFSAAQFWDVFPSAIKQKESLVPCLKISPWTAQLQPFCYQISTLLFEIFKENFFKNGNGSNMLLPSWSLNIWGEGELKCAILLNMMPPLHWCHYSLPAAQGSVLQPHSPGKLSIFAQSTVSGKQCADKHKIHSVQCILWDKLLVSCHRCRRGNSNLLTV